MGPVLFMRRKDHLMEEDGVCCGNYDGLFTCSSFYHPQDIHLSDHSFPATLQAKCIDHGLTRCSHGVYPMGPQEMAFHGMQVTVYRASVGELGLLKERVVAEPSLDILVLQTNTSS